MYFLNYVSECVGNPGKFWKLVQIYEKKIRPLITLPKQVMRASGPIWKEVEGAQPM
jgi:hypothetical protein